MITLRQAMCGLFLVTGAATFAGQHGSGVSSVPAAGVSKSADASSSSASRRPSLAYYTQTLSGGMFGAQTPAPAAPPKVRPASKKRRTTRSPVSAPAENPLADYAFTGLVTVAGRTSALIEHTKTREGLYLAIGDRFLSGKITGIDGQRVTLALNGAKLSLARSENYKLTPLDASAPFLRGGAGVAANPPASAPPGQPGPVIPPPVVIDGSPPLTPPPGTFPIPAGELPGIPGGETPVEQKGAEGSPVTEGQALPPPPVPIPAGEG